MINDIDMTLVEELQSCYSDFYKDVHGFRPRSSTDEQWNSTEWLQGEIDDLHRYLANLDRTEGGRVMLREMGFSTSDKEADKTHGGRVMLREMGFSTYAEADRMDAVLSELSAPPTEAEQLELDMK